LSGHWLSSCLPRVVSAHKIDAAFILPVLFFALNRFTCHFASFSLFSLLQLDFSSKNVYILIISYIFSVVKSFFNFSSVYIQKLLRYS